MICDKCNHKLPDDSAFCQYCGNKMTPIEGPVSAAQSAEGVFDAPDVLVSPKKEETAPEEQPAARKTEEPSNLPTQDAEVVVHIVPNDTKTKKKKVRYCSRCGSLIDSQTKQCTGCGKKYFKGIRFNKVSWIVLSFSLVLLAAIAVITYQHKENASLEEKIIGLQRQNSTLQGQRNVFTEMFEAEKRKMSIEMKSFDVAIVPDDGTKKYHKYGCSEIDTSDGIWIYNIRKAMSKGYYACAKCH
ncbi:MAG: zinc ribbon domain-containing protein [Oscillospiraceae bacterium]|nr:zinc ribbon domain-containing protein [Oscillospiraceae bacterium]